VDLEPDMFRYANVNHVTWMRDEELIVYANNAGGTYRSRTFLTRGAQPRVAASMGNRFVVWQDHLGHPFVAVYRNGQWVGQDLTPTATSQQLVVAVTAARGVGHPPGRKPREQPPLRHRQHLTPGPTHRHLGRLSSRTPSGSASSVTWPSSTRARTSRP
jgi:hypothetical protein